MAVLDRLKRLVKTVNVVVYVVYIGEAHATDTWPIGFPGARASHKSMGDRLEAAGDFQRKHPELNVLVDPFDNSWSKVYESWPWRFWVISPDEHGTPKIRLVSVLKEMNGDPNFDFGDLEDYVKENHR